MAGEKAIRTLPTIPTTTSNLSYDPKNPPPPSDIPPPPSQFDSGSSNPSRQENLSSTLLPPPFISKIPKSPSQDPTVEMYKDSEDSREKGDLSSSSDSQEEKKNKKRKTGTPKSSSIPITPTSHSGTLINPEEGNNNDNQGEKKQLEIQLIEDKEARLIIEAALPAWWETFLGKYSTVFEAAPGVPLAAWFILKVADIDAGNAVLNVLLHHAAPAYAASVLFVIVGSAIKYGLLYQEEKRKDPDLTLGKFLSAHGKEMMLFMSSLLLVGGGAFTTYSWMKEVFIAAGYDVISQNVFPSLLGVMVFAAGKILPPLRDVPVTKLVEIASVFAGFSLGGELAKIFNLTEMAPKLLVPTASVIVTTAYTINSLNVWKTPAQKICESAYKAGKNIYRFFNTTNNNQDYKRLETNTIEISEEKSNNTGISFGY